MADENITKQIPTAVQAKINFYAVQADFAVRLLEEFSSRSVIVYVYRRRPDGSVDYGFEQRNDSSVTNDKIIEYAFAHNGRFKVGDGNFTFKRFLAFLKKTEEYLDTLYKTYPEYFPQLRDRNRWDEIRQNLEFGTIPETRSTQADLFDSLDVAAEILEIILRLRDESVAPAVEEEEEQPLKEEPPTPGGAISGPSVPIGGILKDKKVEEQEKKEQEEKKKEEEKKKPEEDKKNFLSEMARGDAAFHKEIIRMEVMLSTQLAEFYAADLPQKEKEQFRQEILPFIAPMLYFELQKLDPQKLATALKDPKDRLNIYLNTLVRMQQDPAFRARVSLSLQKGLKQKPPKDEEEKEQREAQVAKLDAKAVVAAIAQEREEQGQNLSDEEIQAAIKLQTTSTATLADEIRKMLGEDGARLAESDINNILVRLQTLAITRANVHSLTLEQYQDIFGRAFTRQGRADFNRLQKYLGNSDLPWRNLFSAYIQSARLHAYTQTHNPAALYMDPLVQPVPKTLDYWHKVVFENGPSATTDALYLSRKEVTEKNDQNVLATLAIKDTSAKVLKKLAHLNPIQQRAIIKYLGKSLDDGVYGELHFDEIFEFIQAFSEDEDMDPDSLEFYDSFVVAPDFLQGTVEDGVYRPGQQAGGQGAKGGLPKIGGKSVQRWAALAATALIAPEVLPILDKVENFQKIIAKIPGGDKINGLIDKHFWEAFDKIGVAIIALAIMSLLALLAPIISVVVAVVQAANLFSSIVDFLKTTASNIATWTKSVISKGASALGNFATTIGHALGGLTASGINAIAVTMGGSLFGGVAIALGSAGIMALSIIGLTDLNGAFQTNVTGIKPVKIGSYATGIGNQGCWPSSGRVNVLDKYGNGKPHGTTTQCFTGLTGEHVCGVGPNGHGEAIDIAAVEGTIVYAPYAGEATFYRDGTGVCYWSILNILKSCGYGNHVVLKSHVNGTDLIFIFAHLLDFGNYADGQTGVPINIGDVIGRVDDTGDGSHGNHLHYEVLGAHRDEIIPEPVVLQQQIISSCDPGNGGP